MEIPDLNNLYMKYYDEDFEILGISISDNKEQLINFTKGYKIQYPLLWGAQNIMQNILLQYGGVYSIPMILLIGWRGSPNIKDEPQHIMTGKNIIKMLKLFDIKTCILKSDKDFKKVTKLIKFTKSKKKPIDCIIEQKVI